MITAVRIKNLRSLADTDYIEIKPITLLLGANSSGKSTFLRSFPLFTQSVNKNLRGPISWFDDSLVDFGDYHTAKNKYAGEGETIVFEYKMRRPFQGRIRKFLRRIDDYVIVDALQAAQLSFSLNNDNKGTYINEVNIEVDGLHLKINTPDRNGKLQFEINGQTIEIEQHVKWDASSYGSILPHLEVKPKDLRPGEVAPSFYQVILTMVDGFVKKRSVRRLSRHEGAEIIYEKWNKDKERFLFVVKNKCPIKSFRNYVSGWTVENPEFNELYYMIALSKMMPVWEYLDNELSSFYVSCGYIAPTRAEANRYYRTQGLQVSDIDSYGKNLPEFISSLTPKMMESYNDYTKNILGVTVKTKVETGHHSIMVSNEQRELNITDVGFGYSQILPIITKLWYASNRKSFRYMGLTATRMGMDSVMLMEQPELHLHPAYQAKIADAFINTALFNWDDEYKIHKLRLVAETHSDTILNRIGRRVREGVISPDDVNIILFEKRFGENVTRVRQTTYNEKGQIKEWPFGFFDPEED